MCFQLMADEIVAKFQWLGSKCGVAKKPDPVVDEDDPHKHLPVSRKASMNRRPSMKRSTTSTTLGRNSFRHQNKSTRNLSRSKTNLSPKTPRHNMADRSPNTPRRIRIPASPMATPRHAE